MFPKSVSFSVLLPSSLVADAPNLKEKTLKVGLVGRGLAIFCVPKVVLYYDNDPKVSDHESEINFIASLLRYMDTPQYLRRLLFPRKRDFRYVGLLPPLRTPHHPLQNIKVKPGSYREAAVVEFDGEKSLLEIGQPEKGVLDEKLEVGQRLTVKLGERKGGLISLSRAQRAEISEYWGFEVLTTGSLFNALNLVNADYVIGTSRYGRNINEAIPEIEKRKPSQMAIVFGGPYQGLLEICKRQGVEPKRLFDVMVNTIPNQGTETVRTEEALLATLALLNAMILGK